MISLVTAAINKLDNLRKYIDNLVKYNHELDNIRIIVVDEGDKAVRRYNRRICNKIEFYGPSERKDWFIKNGLEKYMDVIPERHHAELSFAFLVARNSDYIMTFDDDTYPLSSEDFVGKHLLSYGIYDVQVQLAKWINPLDFMEVENSCGRVYQRGLPYSAVPELEGEGMEIGNAMNKVVFNQGLWTNIPDLNAVTILNQGGLKGIPKVRTLELKYEKILVPRNTFIPVSSMNISFKPEILPAYYYLPMRVHDASMVRYSDGDIRGMDDVWSALFLKKVMDRVGKYMAFGAPLVEHRKKPRDIFRDLANELDGLIINEKLWKVLDDIKLESRDYLEGYRELAVNLRDKSAEFGYYRKFIEYLARHMMKWSELWEHLS